MGFRNIHSVAIYQENLKGPFGDKKNRKKSNKAEKRGESLTGEKKRNGGNGIVFQVRDFGRVQNEVLFMVKVHSAQKVDRSS